MPQKHELLPVMVSLTRSGLPRIIPPFHRRRILRKDDRAESAQTCRRDLPELELASTRAS